MQKGTKYPGWWQKSVQNGEKDLKLVAKKTKRKKRVKKDLKLVAKKGKKGVKKDLKLRLLAPQQLPPGSHCCLQVVGYLSVVCVTCVIVHHYQNHPRFLRQCNV